MQNVRIIGLIGALLCTVAGTSAKSLSVTNGDFEYTFAGLFRPEMFYGKNVSLFNDNVASDRTWFARHTLDLSLDVNYGKEWYEYTPVEFFFSMRNKAIWGNPASIAATTEATIKDTDVVTGEHSHKIPRHFFWIREAWIAMELAELLGLSFANHHTLTLGAFSFELGRGIALGDAFAVGPEILGFYTELAVDQYAFGGKLSGEIIPRQLYYDLYTAILNNKSADLGDTAERIRSQEFGKRFDPVRGFGIINYIFAGRFKWHAFNSDRFGKLTIEPYGLYNRDPEEKIDRVGDAVGQLGTLGCAAEYEGSVIDFGFDWAFNLGQQRVKALDRNQLIKQNRDGMIAVVNSHVVDQNGKNIPFTSEKSDAQRLITNSFLNEFNQKENGQVIGVIEDRVGFVQGPVTLINDKNRFRDPYTNRLRGWMFVTDAGVWLHKKELQWAVTAGIASGDENPNDEAIDGTFDGFIGLQELYSGKRVRSVFLLGGAGKAKRPLSIPDPERSPNKFARNVSRFTNLVFCGTALLWKPQGCLEGFAMNPNLLVYWQERATRKFDLKTRKQVDALASNFLGVETALFMHYFVLDSLKAFFVGSIFFPGSHYNDIRGLPLTKDQSEALDRLDTTGFNQERIPNLGTDTAYTFNIGLEYRF